MPLALSGKLPTIFLLDSGVGKPVCKRKGIVSRIGKCQLKLNLELNLRLAAAGWRHLLKMAKDEAVGVKKLI